MAQVNIDIAGAQYTDVPAIDVPKHAGGTARFTEVSDTTATASDVMSGSYFYTAAGVRTQGTATGSTYTEELNSAGGLTVTITG